jgi:hypothetical protein
MTHTNVEIAIMDEDDFYKLWREQSLRVELKGSPYFGEFSEVTLYLIANECLEIREFKKGDLIVSQAKRSPLNVYFKGFYQNMISKFGLKIKKSYEKRAKRK